MSKLRKIDSNLLEELENGRFKVFVDFVRERNNELTLLFRNNMVTIYYENHMIWKLSLSASRKKPKVEIRGFQRW